MNATLHPDWPQLPLAQWQDTYTTLHMWTQIVGKTRLALAPMQNHWWQIAFYVTPRGLTTSAMPAGDRILAIDFDFIEHKLWLRSNDGSTQALALVARTVADFYGEYMSVLKRLGVNVALKPSPVEVQTAIPFPDDREHASYDPDAANRCWRILVNADRALKGFRGRFIGKASPVHFFWGSFDLAATRFSGRPAPAHPGGAPNCPDYVMVEAYSHECSSCGFWPGGGSIAEPVFYSYAYPEPPGYSERAPGPAGAYYHREMHEFVLPYEAVRQAPSPEEALLEFFQATYDAAADCGRWERSALDRPQHAWP